MIKLNPAFLIALVYFLMGILWVSLTDILTYRQSSSVAFFQELQTYKGILYIFITSLALFFLIRQTNKKLQEKGEEYQVLFEDNPNAMWVCNADHSRFLAVNRAALEHYGYSREEFLALTPKDIRPPEDQQPFLLAAREHSEEFLDFGNWRLLKKNGEIVHAEIHWHKVVFQGQHAFLGLITDITARIQAEAERNMLILELTGQNQDLQQFAYITSHNLRAPIANLMGLVDLYEPENKPEENQQIISKLGESARNLDMVVRDLNDLLVIRARQQEEKQVVPFESAFRFILHSLQGDLGASRARLQVDFSRAPEVISVRSFVQSIFYNLLTNAIKYRAPDRELQIEVTSYRTDNAVCLEVKDNGLGIDLKKHQQKLFGMYKRFHTHIRGKGLGLHLVKTQIEALGGSIEVESEIGEGAAFKVFFPDRLL